MMVKVMVALSGAGLDITLLGTLGGAVPGDKTVPYKGIKKAHVATLYCMHRMALMHGVQNNNVTSNSHHGTTHSSYWG